MGWTVYMVQSLVGIFVPFIYPCSLALYYAARLQYLDAKDLDVYLKALLDSRSLLEQDGNYITVFHQQHLTTASAKYVSCA